MVSRDEYNIGAFNIFSLEKLSRYQLERVWDQDKPKCGIIMFNPREVNPNPFILGQTLGRITRLIYKEYGSISVVNLFAKTSGSKSSLDKKYKIFDEDNYKYIKKTVEESDIIILFWGNGGTKVSRNKKFTSLLKDNSNKLRCFGITNKNQPIYERTLGENNKLYKCMIDENGNVFLVN